MPEDPAELDVERRAPRRMAAQVVGERRVGDVFLVEARAMDQQLADRHRRQSRIGRLPDPRHRPGKRLRQRRLKGKPAALDQAGDADARHGLGQAGNGHGRAHRLLAHGRLANRATAMHDREPTRLATLLGHPGAPCLLDAVDRLGLCPANGARKQNEDQDGKGGPERTHDWLAATTFGTDLCAGTSRKSPGETS